MTVSVNDILVCASLTGGKFPDLFWEFDLSGCELRVLNYVFSNCYRIYTQLKWFPKGKDGSPRYWRNKEKMAEECGVSTVSFRNAIRKLHKAGLTTQMDVDTGDNDMDCVGLSSEFLSLLTTENFFRSSYISFISNVCEVLYNQSTCKYISTLVDNNYFYFVKITGTASKSLENQFSTSGKTTEAIEVPETLESVKNSPENSHDATMVEHKKFQGKRKHIKVERKPIYHCLPELVRQQTMKNKLNMLKSVKTPHERKIFDMSDYYNYRCRLAINATGFVSLPKNNTKTREQHWKWFECILKVCEEHDWDYKIYIDAQFDRSKLFGRGQKYPYLNQMYSQKAQEYYEKYIKDYKESNSVDGDIEVKSDEVKSTYDIIFDNINSDCESMKSSLDRESRRRVNRNLTTEQLKILYISEHWMNMSSYYLACVPWFNTYLNQFPDEPVVSNLKDEIKRIQKSNSMMVNINKMIGDAEDSMGLPRVMEL